MIPNQNQPILQKEQQRPIQNQNQKNKCIQFLFEKQFQIISAPRGLFLMILGLAIIFAVLCIATAILAYRVKNIQIDYADGRKCTSTSLTTEKCSVKFTVSESMPAPIYVLYSIKNVYINHRRFLNSYSLDQLKGKVISTEEADTACAPFKFNKNIPENVSWAGSPLDKQNIASPCGIKPQGYFNDTIALYKNGQNITIDRKLNQKINAVNTHRAPSSESTQWVDPENQHFKQYLLDGSLMTKKRVWGVIRDDLAAGNYQLLVNNNYQLADLRIIKGVLFTTSTIIGGKQYFYPICFGLAALACLGFAILVQVKFRNYGTLRQHHKRVL